MNLRKHNFLFLVFLTLLFLAIQCQNNNEPTTNKEEVLPKVISVSDDSLSKSSSSSSSNSSSSNSNKNSSSNSNGNINKNQGISSATSNDSNNDKVLESNNSNGDNKSTNNDSQDNSNSSSLIRIEKAKAERIETIEIEKADLEISNLKIVSNIFFFLKKMLIINLDKNGFKIAISTPNVFDENSVVDIKWQAIDGMEPSSTIKIELHTNLTRKNDYFAYPTTETIVIDDNIPSNVNEINWNPYLKLKKNEKYFIRVWAYTNNNTATMSGLCIWSINDLLSEDKNTKTTKNNKASIVKLITFPTIGALLCFTVIGHFVHQNKQYKKYKSVNGYSDGDSEDGFANKGENIYYDAIKVEGNTGYNTLPQPWELEARRKHMMMHNQASLSDGSIQPKLGNGNEIFDNVNLNETNYNEPISITIEKPQSIKIQKKVNGPTTNSIRSHHHHHHNSSGNSYDSHVSLLKERKSIK
ncbi:hypothetical protein LY90DRAFT_706260 [Neocallimastix californiae]|uniref:Fibronectin type-III domain-containing protein n=1 Tax=Neocallimastix californiae TaxID=1754190 RepID=A0A1Y2AT25_9FUNG|nr:hypothetical protein LY90DRAFT_706260 [Neocallimastix californiae]|eukprot:ORY25701.1 hypothetical protein LY90DRAFT_706260 [Neocallimastix californiae]